jgi:hypothetical protein
MTEVVMLIRLHALLLCNYVWCTNSGNKPVIHLKFDVLAAFILFEKSWWGKCSHHPPPLKTEMSTSLVPKRCTIRLLKYQLENDNVDFVWPHSESPPQGLVAGSLKNYLF